MASICDGWSLRCVGHGSSTYSGSHQRPKQQIKRSVRQGHKHSLSFPLIATSTAWQATCDPAGAKDAHHRAVRLTADLHQKSPRQSKGRGLFCRGMDHDNPVPCFPIHWFCMAFSPGASGSPAGVQFIEGTRLGNVVLLPLLAVMTMPPFPSAMNVPGMLVIFPLPSFEKISTLPFRQKT